MAALSISGQKSIPIIDTYGMLKGKNKSDQQRALVNVALTHKLPVKPVELKGLERMSLFVPPVLGAKVNLVAQKEGMSFQQAWAALAVIGQIHLKQKSDQLELEAGKIPSPVISFSKGQKEMFAGIQAGFQKNMITLAEGSTGFGKAWVASATALTQFQDGKGPIIIAAPTLAVLGHLWVEMGSVKKLMLKEKTLTKIPSIAFFPGATEFVNSDKLIAYLESVDPNDQSKQDNAVFKWAEAGAKPLSKDSPLVEAMISMQVNPTWLMDDLKKLAVNLNPNEFGINIHDDCANAETLAHVRDIAKDADIIFATHAMLAVSQRSKWALLPQPNVLIIDEAHQLESNYANIYSNKLSLSRLRREMNQFAGKDLPGKTIAKNAVKALSILIKTIQSVEIQSGSDRIEVTPEKLGSKHGVIFEQSKSLSKLLKNKLMKQIDGMPFHISLFNDFERILLKQTQDKSYIEFSPSRRFPSLLVGKSELGGILGALWKSCEGGALLMSATIFVTDTYGNNKSDYFCRNNALPASRTHQLNPFVSPWITSVPTLYTPSQNKLTALSRITKSTPEENESWLENISHEVTKIIHQAKGGTLILATSYEQVEFLTEKLLEHNVEPSRIAPQKRDIKFAEIESSFRKKHHQNKRPILIGLGSAWTGVNLKDSCDPTEDTMLTDLVVLCLPIGLNRTCTQLSRIDRFKMYPIIQEALMLLKQGFGRLMRHKDQTDRNLWLLDGRIWQPWPGMKNLQVSVKRMLEKYEKTKEF